MKGKVAKVCVTVAAGPALLMLEGGLSKVCVYVQLSPSLPRLRPVIFRAFRLILPKNEER